MTPLRLVLGAIVESLAPQDNGNLLVDLAKYVLASSKSKGYPLALCLMQRPFKKVYFASPSWSGRKKDQEKTKLT